MAKAIAKMGYTNYVLDIEDAMVLARILSGAERYESKYQPKEEGGTLFYIWQPVAVEEGDFTIRPITDSFYNMAKLAGEPERN